MTFAGLPLATLLTIAGVFGALTTALYILKLRRRPVPVPFSPIWARVLRDKEATQLFSQLKRLLSLLLQLALIGLLIFALGDPRMGGELVDGRNLVVLVDASASMKAHDVSPSRIDQAKTEVSKLIEGLGGNDRMLVAQMDAVLTPVSTMTGETAELKQALTRVGASDTEADLELGLRFALDSLSGLPKPEIIIVSDGALGDLEALAKHVKLGDIALSFIPIGESGDNVAITQFAVRRYPLDKSRYEVMLEVSNTMDSSMEVELSLFGDGAVVDVTRLNLKPGERLPRFYSDLAGADQTLEAKIEPVGAKLDHLEADNHAYAVMPQRRRVRVLVVSPGNTYLEAALLLDEYLDVSLVSPDSALPDEAFDVTILDGVAPSVKAKHGSLLYLNPPAEGAPVSHKKEITEFGFDLWNRKSPLLRWMALENIQVMKGHALEPQKGDSVVGRSDAGPILLSGERSGQRFVALGFDPRDSDIVLRVAWPLFLLNTINTFIEEESGYISSYRTGSVWSIPTASGARVAKLKDPDGTVSTVPVKEGRAVYFGDQAGFYELMVGDAPEVEVSKFAANLSNLNESRIKPNDKLELAGNTAKEVAGFDVGVREELWLTLLLIAMALSVAEWITYHRRVTV